MLCRNADTGTVLQNCELFHAFEDGPFDGTFCGRLHIQMDVHLNEFFCGP